MRIALLSDVHGNRLALDVCLEHADALGVDELVFLGDAVGYLPDAAACVERLTVEGLACQQGNHEAMLLGPNTATRERELADRLADARAQLAPEALAAIAGWPEARTLQRDGPRIPLVHGVATSRSTATSIPTPSSTGGMTCHTTPCSWDTRTVRSSRAATNAGRERRLRSA